MKNEELKRINSAIALYLSTLSSTNIAPSNNNRKQTSISKQQQSNKEIGFGIDVQDLSTHFVGHMNISIRISLFGKKNYSFFHSFIHFSCFFCFFVFNQR